VTAEEFMRRFLQHVLPDRFVKVRYYGLLAPACRQLLQQVRQGLSASIGKLKSAELITTAPVARYVFGFELQNLLIGLNRSSNVTSILASESLFQ